MYIYIYYVIYHYKPMDFLLFSWPFLALSGAILEPGEDHGRVRGVRGSPWTDREGFGGSAI